VQRSIRETVTTVVFVDPIAERVHALSKAPQLTEDLPLERMSPVNGQVIGAASDFVGEARLLVYLELARHRSNHRREVVEERRLPPDRIL
jgi:hypothetical protein